ncbi:MAG: hypothetical protein ACJAYB_000055 [Psychromonas sp.]|jgi:hypothetical protein
MNLSIQGLNDLLDGSQYQAVGIRAMTGGFVVNPGDEINDSFVWVDGECTDETLEGASALNLEFDGWEVQSDRFNEMLLQSKSYGHENQLVVVGCCGNDHYEGNDMNEVVLPNAVCIAII